MVGGELRVSLGHVEERRAAMRFIWQQGRSRNYRTEKRTQTEETGNQKTVKAMHRLIGEIFEDTHVGSGDTD